jgi:photosystem II stability/assembly factor-like uncharacterized protein
MLPSASPTTHLFPRERPRRRATGRGRVTSATAAAAVAAALAVSGCSAEPEHTAHDGELTIEHVHGLGVDPADGQLYAGTHHGIVHVSSGGELTRIADRVQDFMGFTVVGPRHFLASGHPGPGESGPSDLGLIESNDGGQTWSTLSLAGEADFHALDAAEGVIYGYTAGALLASQDGRTWENRREMALADLAVDPTEPQRLLVTTETGPALSADGGRSFSQPAGAPLLQLVAFTPDEGGAVGVAPDGTVYASSDDGWTWTPSGNAGGAPEALGVDGDKVYVALEGAIVSSIDGGATFTDLYRRR